MTKQWKCHPCNILNTKHLCSKCNKDTNELHYIIPDVDPENIWKYPWGCGLDTANKAWYYKDYSKWGKNKIAGIS